jgi:hypothetical protein
MSSSASRRPVFRKYWFAAAICLAALAALLFSSCALEDPNAGSLTIDVSETFTASTILPGIDMIPASYEFHGTGPGEFTVSSSDLPCTISPLKPGDWLVEVTAFNAHDQRIAYGNASATLQAQENKSVSVTVAPVQGHGSLDMEVRWNPNEVAVPSVEGELTSGPSNPIALSFTVDRSAGSAVVSIPDVPTGYYTLSIQLLDWSEPVAGAVEVVRIVDSTSTSGTLEFQNVYLDSGSFTMEVTPEMSEPLDVSLSGAAPELCEGTTMQVQAAVSPDDTSISVSWYLNSASVGSGRSIDIGSGLQPGIYRLDAVAVDGQRTTSGSATHSFTVVENPVVSFAWDPSPDSSVTGYNMHYGNSSGNYTECIDVGNNDTWSCSGLVPGTTYYFAVTAYNSQGLESDYSNEVVYTHTF